MTLQDWKHVLKLSTMYGMVDMRQLAIEHLGKLISSDVIESVVLAKAYEVSAWLKEGYVELVKRIPPLTVEEAQRIGWETAIQIFRVREVALVKQAGNRGYVRYNGTLLDNDVRVHVEREFEEEFAKADAASLRHVTP